MTQVLSDLGASLAADRVVLAHGCFDLLHLGHIRHLQEAKKLGDKLVVSVTADDHVAKGVGRPHFNAAQRAEALLSLACVDEVLINEHADATTAIARVKPDIYVKGIDYSNRTDAGLEKERIAVEAIGGKLVFTDTEKFSSSRLINSEKFSIDVLEYLERARVAGFKDQILAAFEAADKLKVAFVGETIIDEYRYVKALGRASKEFMLACVQLGQEDFAGGVVAAAAHGEWKHADVFSPQNQIRKVRYVDADFNRKLLDIYSARRIDLAGPMRERFRHVLEIVMSNFDVLVLLDFGHGLMGEEERVIISLEHSSGVPPFLAINAQTNAGNYGFNLVTKYTEADFVCVDDPEARLATHRQDGPIRPALEGISDLLNCEDVLVTHGKFGSSFLHGDDFGEAPAFISGGVDTMGAGDAVMAVTAPLLAAGLSLPAAALVGNVAGAIKTSIIGHRRHVGRQEIIQTVEALLA